MPALAPSARVIPARRVATDARQGETDKSPLNWVSPDPQRRDPPRILQ